MTDIAPRTRLAPAARRAQIVQEATRLISASGFNAVSLASIAEACGIRKPSVLHYFPSMNELLLAVLTERDQADFAWAGGESATVLGREAARHFLELVVERNLRQREIVRMFAVLRAEALDPAHPAHEYFSDRQKHTEAFIDQLFRWSSEPVRLSHRLRAFWTGLEFEWLWDHDLDVFGYWSAELDELFDPAFEITA